MPKQHDEDEAQAKVKQLIDTIVEGVGAKDLERIKQAYSADVVSFDVEPPLQHAGIDAKLKNWARVFTILDDVKYEVRDLTLTVDDDVTFGHGFGRLSGTLNNGMTTSGMWVRASPLGYRVPVGPVGHRTREQLAHRRGVMVRQVVVDRAGGNRSRCGEGQSRERLRVVERGNLSDHPADTDAGQVRRPVVEFAGECCGVGGEIAQCVRRRLGINSDRRPGVAEVVPHDVTPAARQGLAKGVGPREHGRATRAQNERRRRVTEVLNAEGDAVRLDRGHHANPSAMTPRDAWNGQIVGYIVASRQRR